MDRILLEPVLTGDQMTQSRRIILVGALSDGRKKGIAAKVAPTCWSPS